MFNTHNKKHMISSQELPESSLLKNKFSARVRYETDHCSLFDRLQPIEGEHLRDEDTVSHVKSTFMRDLENLLNTRLRFSIKPFTELDYSVLNYGVPSYGSLPISDSRARLTFAQQIKNCIEVFEPRLKQVCVEVSSGPVGAENVLILHIRGHIEVSGKFEHLGFYSSLLGLDSTFRLQTSDSEGYPYG